MPKNKRLMSGLLAVPLVTILLITGCSVQNPSPSESPNPSPSISAPANPTPAPSQTEEPPAPEVTVGTNVDAATAAELNADSKGQYRGYAMPDGSFIVVDKTAPLPEAVQQDVNSKGQNYSSQFGSDPREGVSQQALSERGSIISEVSRNTGKRAILVLQVSGYANPDDASPTTFYITNGSGPQPVSGAFMNREEITQYVNDWLAQQSNPNDYVVIWG